MLSKKKGRWEACVALWYISTFGARRPPASQALPSSPLFHEKNLLRTSSCTHMERSGPSPRLLVVAATVTRPGQVRFITEERGHPLRAAREEEGTLQPEDSKKF